MGAVAQFRLPLGVRFRPLSPGETALRLIYYVQPVPVCYHRGSLVFFFGSYLMRERLSLLFLVALLFLTRRVLVLVSCLPQHHISHDQAFLVAFACVRLS